MDEAQLAEIEAGHPCEAGSGCVLMDLVAEVKRLLAREDAVFAKGYRVGYWYGSGQNVSPWQGEVDEARTDWVAGGRRTHF